jgi:hypothetical protein
MGATKESSILETTAAKEEAEKQNVVDRLNRKLNKALGLPRGLSHDWRLVQVYQGQTPSWQNFRKNAGDNMPVTKVGDHVIGAVNMTRISFRAGGYLGPNTYEFRLLDHEPSLDEATQIGFEPPRFVSSSTRFRNRADLDRILSAKQQ